MASTWPRAAPSTDAEVENATFSFHHMANGLNFQQMSNADGIIIGFWGPAGSRRNDARMYHEHGIRQQLVPRFALKNHSAAGLAARAVTRPDSGPRSVS